MSVYQSNVLPAIYGLNCTILICINSLSYHLCLESLPVAVDHIEIIDISFQNGGNLIYRSPVEEEAIPGRQAGDLSSWSSSAYIPLTKVRVVTTLSNLSDLRPGLCYFKYIPQWVLKDEKFTSREIMISQTI